MNKLKDKIKKLTKNPFISQISVLVSGTAIGQLVAILSLPILTRLYEPDAFSTLAVYVSVSSLFTVASGLCYEYAVPLPRSNRVAAALCMIAVTSVFTFTVLSALIVFTITHYSSMLINNKLSDFIWIIPIGVLTIGFYNVLQYWSTRNRKFKLIAKTRVTQSICGTSIKLGVGFISASTAGLIFGQLLSQGAGFVSLGSSLLKNDKLLFKSVRLKHIKLALNRYKKFPKFTTLEVFTNTAGIQLPIVIIAYFAVGAEAGYLMIAMQLLSTPLGMIESAVSQVYLAEGAERYHRGELKQFTIKTILNLAKIASLPLIITAFVAPTLMPYLLGEEWSRAGILISWMTPWFFMQFMTSPVSAILYITDNQKLAFLLQLIGLVIRVGAVFFAATYEKNYIGEFYALSGFVFYLIYIIVILTVVNRIESYRSIRGSNGR